MAKTADHRLRARGWVGSSIWTILALAAVLLVLGCSGSATVAPTQAPLPTATTPAPTPPPAEEEDTTWNLVVLGEVPQTSTLTAYFDMYAAYIEEDLGVEVTVHEKAATRATADWLLVVLQSDEALRSLISDADVIVVWVGGTDFERLLYGNQGVSPPPCGSTANLDLACVKEGEQVIVTKVDAILKEILSLRSPDQAMIRVADLCNFWTAYWIDDGVFEQLGPVFSDLSGTIDALAQEYGAAVVPTYLACNGENGDKVLDRDLTEWKIASPYVFSEAGHRMIADVLREVGYERSP